MQPSVDNLKQKKKIAAQKEANRIRTKNYRKRKQKEQSARKELNKIWKQNSRQRLLNAARRGDTEAIKKREALKEANRIRSREYRKRKRENKRQSGN